MKAGRRAWSLFLLPFLLCALPACRNTTGQELLESELRSKEILYREALDELKNSEFRNQSLLREIFALRQQAPLRPSPEEAAHTFTLKRIVLGRMTGGLDQDGAPGDESLHVVIEPRDGEDQPLRAPGQVRITALQVSAEGLKTPIGTWDVGPEQLRRTWKSGILSSGYVLILPWKTPPSAETVRVVARLTLPDGRVFEDDRDVRVRLGTALPRRTDPPAPPHPGPELPLPPPRPLEVPPAESTQSQRVPTAVTPAAEWQPVPLNHGLRVRPPQPVREGP